MYSNRNRGIFAFILVALLTTTVILAQSAELQHADAKDHGPTFHSLDRFVLVFRTDGTVPDSEIASAYAVFNPTPDGGNPTRSAFGADCSTGNPNNPLIVRDGKLVCDNLVIPGNVMSGRYALTNLVLGQANLNRGHNFIIRPIYIEVISTQEHQMKLFDENRPKDVNIEKR